MDHPLDPNLQHLVIKDQAPQDLKLLDQNIQETVPQDINHPDQKILQDLNPLN